MLGRRVSVSRIVASRRWRRRFLSSSSSNSSYERTNHFKIHEVTARDGIQNEKKVLSLEEKVQLVKKLVECQPSSVEVCSFVREDLVPAMAGSKDLVQELQTAEWAINARKSGMDFAALVPNMRGYETFRKASGIETNHENDPALNTIVCLTSCTESHSMANVKMPLNKALNTTIKVMEQAKMDGFKVRAYCSLAFECPFEGSVDPQQVLDIVKAYEESGADTIVLADTLGQALPGQVEKLISMVLDFGIPAEKLAMHMHNAHGRAQENLIVAANMGISGFDSALGGAGGCNFVPDAKGNVSTQALVAALNHHLKIPSHPDLQIDTLDETSVFLQDILGRSLELDYELKV